MIGRASRHDLRERIVQAAQAGLRHCEIARRLQVSRSTVERLVRLNREQQALSPKSRPGPPVRHLPPSGHEAFRAQIHAHPDLTLAEHALGRAPQHRALCTADLAEVARADRHPEKYGTP